MPMPELLPEIWSHVFRFVKRNTPPPYRKATWRDLHQHDLTVVSRVSSTFHEMAIPHLYTAVTVNSLPQFLNDAYDGIEKITSKNKRLARVRNLRIAGIGPSCSAPWRIADLLEEGDWTLVAENIPDYENRTLDQGMQEAFELTELLEFREAYGLDTVLKDVETISVGQRGACGWKHLLADGLLPPWHFGDVAIAAQMLTEFIINCQPQSLCLHERYGPFALHSADFPPSMRSTTVVSHFHAQYHAVAPVFLGGNNVQIVTPGMFWKYSGPTLYGKANPGLGLVALQARLAHFMHQTDSKSAIERTKYVIHGMFDPEIHSELEAQDVVDRGGQGKFKAMRKGLEKGNRLRVVKAIRPDIPKIWQSRFKLSPAESSPCCGACGWTVSEGWDP